MRISARPHSAHSAKHHVATERNLVVLGRRAEGVEDTAKKVSIRRIEKSLGDVMKWRCAESSV